MKVNAKLRLTPFQVKVLLETMRIPLGATVTYKELAQRVGRPKAYRAVANALNRNPLPLIIPCHRVVGCGNWGGYAFGVSLKKVLLGLEKKMSCPPR